MGNGRVLGTSWAPNQHNESNENSLFDQQAALENSSRLQTHAGADPESCGARGRGSCMMPSAADRGLDGTEVFARDCNVYGQNEAGRWADSRWLLRQNLCERSSIAKLTVPMLGITVPQERHPRHPTLAYPFAVMPPLRLGRLPRQPSLTSWSYRPSTLLRTCLARSLVVLLLYSLRPSTPGHRLTLQSWP